MKKKILKAIIIFGVIGTMIFSYLTIKKINTPTGWLYDSGESYATDNLKGGWGGSFDSVSSASITSGAYDSTGTAGGFSLFKGLTSESSSMSSNNLGFSTGGARTIENFRENIKNGYFPISTDITYNGLFYDYSFDTGNAKGKSDDLFYPSYSTAISRDIISGQEEYYMSVGLNSNIKESDFVRKKLNLVVVLDNSGSMGSSFNSYYYDNHNNEEYKSSYKTKMDIADEAVNTLLDQLNPDDRFGMVVFDDQGHIAKYLDEIKESNVDSLKEEILKIKARGGTNFESGYKKALEILDYVNTKDEEYQNRIIVITDAMPNTGDTRSDSLMSLVEKNSKENIYTTFIGVGVDFNTELIEKLGTVTGANYYSVHNENEFKKQMGEEFDFMVTPLVFDLKLDFESKDYELEAVYGTDTENGKKENIMHVNTLFPSKRNDDGEVKGGIILLKLNKKNDNKDGKIELKVSYKDGRGKEHHNEQTVNFDSKEEYYDNTGIRKGIVLTRYANLLKDWILYERSNHKNELLITEKTGIIYPCYDENEIVRLLGEHERTSERLMVSEKSKELFKEMKDYIEKEKIELDDETLSQEIELLTRLINE